MTTSASSSASSSTSAAKAHGGTSGVSRTELGQWVVDSTAATEIRLIDGSTESSLRKSLYSTQCSPRNAAFNPLFTYPIFGQDERVFGLSDLRIQLYFTSGSLDLFVGVTNSAKIDDYRHDATADDLRRQPRDRGPRDYHIDKDTFGVIAEDAVRKFKPMGKLIKTYKSRRSNHVDSTDDSAETEQADEEPQYEMYLASFETPGFRDYYRKLRMFPVLFIEGATFLSANDPNWLTLLVFRRSVNCNTGQSNGSASWSKYKYDLVGFTTLYRYFHYPNMVRMRISQVVVLPTYQRQGHAEQMYRFVYDRMCRAGDKLAVDLTVEDPSEDYARLRDLSDLRFLIRQTNFGRPAGSAINSNDWLLSADYTKAQEFVDELRAKFKFSQPQANRLFQILLLYSIKNWADVKEREKYRLYVKRHIYARDKDMLLEMSEDERKKALAALYAAIEDDYRTIMNLI
ncbi:acyl-CoA N-acyltransferase [Ramicandelaber brevisporus]|nr:acyl-CoA N-acyltransferase [Ramicandelaber brevisporus]